MIISLPLAKNKLFTGITKEYLVDYYSHVASIILPYLKNRPQLLQSQPSAGSESNFYWQSLNKEIVYSAPFEGENKYIICNDEATLMEMANHGWVEINPWSSTVSNPGFPDWAVINLKPFDVPFKEVVRAALQVKKVLDRMEVHAYCKTSGSSGLHVYIPLRGNHGYKSARKFAEYVVQQVYMALPGTTTLLQPSSKKRKKVYLDFLQNEQGQTLVAPYSMTADATVSTPLEWREVNANLNPAAFTAAAVLKRLDKRGDIWKPLLDEGANLHNVLYRLVIHRAD